LYQAKSTRIGGALQVCNQRLRHAQDMPALLACVPRRRSLRSGRMRASEAASANSPSSPSFFLRSSSAQRRPNQAARSRHVGTLACWPCTACCALNLVIREAPCAGEHRRRPLHVAARPLHNASVVRFVSARVGTRRLCSSSVARSDHRRQNRSRKAKAVSCLSIVASGNSSPTSI